MSIIVRAGTANSGIIQNSTEFLTVDTSNNTTIPNNLTVTGTLSTNAAVVPVVNATGTLTIPVGTTAARPVGVAGMMRLNSTTGFSEYYNGTSWVSVVGARPALTQKAIFGYGDTGAATSITNLVSNTGVVANDVTGVGTARHVLAAASYGTDKAIFGYGYSGGPASMTNLVSNTGVVSADVTGIGTARSNLGAAGYGTDKAIFGYGDTGAVVSMTNLVSNTGVVSTDVTGIGTARVYLAAAGFSLS